MSRYEVRVDATFVGDQEIIAMCATGRNAGKRAAWIARCSPASIAPLLALIEQLAAELAAKELSFEGLEQLARRTYEIECEKWGYDPCWDDEPPECRKRHMAMARVSRAMHRHEIDALKSRATTAEAISSPQSERIAVLEAALRDVLVTGLNGGNNIRLAFLAAGGKALSDDLLEKAEASEQAVRRARSALAPLGEE